MSDPVELAPAEPVPGPAPTRCDPAATRRRWADRLARFRTAEHTVAAFCAAEGVSVPALYQWERTLATEGPRPTRRRSFRSGWPPRRRPDRVSVSSVQP